MSDLWFKEAIVYSLDVETFQDSNGDGVGDFPGLTSRLDYLAALGVDCLWLLPFYASPNRDNGYDVSDYYAIDPRHGTPGDFVVFLREATERGMRVILDLVANHTSVDHPWFRAASASRASPFHDYYVWVDDPARAARHEAVFPGEQNGVWKYVPEVDAYYLHHFYEHQADLNWLNPNVSDEFHRIIGYWLELGVSGFRVDAAPYLIDLADKRGERPANPHEILRELRRFVSWRRGDAVLLAEANVPPAEVPSYFGDGDEMNMLFNFLLNQRLFLALARGQAAPLADGLRSFPRAPERATWANFVRNHDELTLDQLSAKERAEVFAAFAPQEAARIYGRGIRRRLPPMLGGDLRRILLAYSLLFALPGTPVLRYGEEIGMGDDLALEGREAVRTTMQWSAERNGGFSTAPSERLCRPAIAGGPYGFERVNVESQRNDRNSMLGHVQRLIRARRECPEFGEGEWEVLDSGDPGVLAHRATWRGGTSLAVHNLTANPLRVKRDLTGDGGRLADVVGDESYPPADGVIELSPYGFRWFHCLPGSEAAGDSRRAGRRLG